MATDTELDQFSNGEAEKQRQALEQQARSKRRQELKDSILREEAALKRETERTEQLKESMKLIPSDTEIDTVARHELLKINRADVTKREMDAARAQRDHDLLIFESSNRKSRDTEEYLDLERVAAKRLQERQEQLQKARDRVKGGFDGAPEDVQKQFFERAQRELMKRTQYEDRQRIMDEYQAAQEARDQHAENLAKLREQTRQAQASNGLATDERRVLDPQDQRERERPPGANISQDVTVEQAAVDRKVADMAFGEQAARDAQVNRPAMSRAERFGGASTQKAAAAYADTEAGARTRAEGRAAETNNDQQAAPTAAEPALKNADTKGRVMTAETVQVKGYQASARDANGQVRYTAADTDRLAFVDNGDEVRLAKQAEKEERSREDIRAALKVASTKFDSISVSGSSDFRGQVADEAAKMGLSDKLANHELREKSIELQKRYESDARAQATQDRERREDEREQLKARVAQVDSPKGQQKQDVQGIRDADRQETKSKIHDEPQARTGENEDGDDLEIISMKQQKKGPQSATENEDDEFNIVSMKQKQKGTETVQSEDGQSPRPKRRGLEVERPSQAG